MRLIDADALLETLGDGPISWTDTPEEIQAVNDWREFVSSINDAPTVGGWVSVEDRLPGECGRYLCWFGKNKMLVGADMALYIPEERAFWNLEWNKPIENITHWMPMSIQPPEEVKRDEAD